MKIHPFKAAIITAAGFCLFLTACSSKPSPAVFATDTAAPVASGTASPVPSTTPTAASTPTPQPSVTATEEGPTVTPTSIPVVWSVPARELPDWPAEGETASWADGHTLTILAWDITIPDWDKNFVQYDLSSSPIARSQGTAAHDPFVKEPSDKLFYSPKGAYAILCTEKTEDKTYHTLELYQVEGAKLISQVKNISTDCWRPVAWAPNEKMLSFQSQRTQAELYNFPFDIYVWKTNGSKPYVVGKGSVMHEPGAWSPDSSRLVVEIYDPGNPDLEETYVVMYPDGREPRSTKAQLGVRSVEPGVTWLTNDIVYESNVFSVSCSSYNYYTADTGEEVTNLSQLSCFSNNSSPNQGLLPSPDQHWSVLEQTNQDFWTDHPVEFTYTLYDLKTSHLYMLSKSDEILLDFVGWGSDSTFYLVRRPVNDQIAAKPDEPFGLLALNPNTRQMRLVNGDIRFAWLSPDKTHFLAATRNGSQLSTAIYDLDGKALTGAVPFRMPEAIKMPSIPKLDSIWDLPSMGEPIDWAWSSDGQTVACKDYGVLWLIGLDGRIQKIAEHLDRAEHYVSFSWDNDSSNTHDFFWSPRDDYLVILTGRQVWAIDIR